MKEGNCSTAIRKEVELTRKTGEGTFRERVDFDWMLSAILSSRSGPNCYASRLGLEDMKHKL